MYDGASTAVGASFAFGVRSETVAASTGEPSVPVFGHIHRFQGWNMTGIRDGCRIGSGAGRVSCRGDLVPGTAIDESMWFFSGPPGGSLIRTAFAQDFGGP